MGYTHFFDDRVTVRKILFIFAIGQAATSNHTVELVLCFPLDVGICRNEGRKPLHDGCNLRKARMLPFHITRAMSVGLTGSTP